MTTRPDMNPGGTQDWINYLEPHSQPAARCMNIQQSAIISIKAKNRDVNSEETRGGEENEKPVIRESWLRDSNQRTDSSGRHNARPLSMNT
jgi:hypothetical protein